MVLYCIVPIPESIVLVLYSWQKCYVAQACCLDMRLNCYIFNFLRLTMFLKTFFFFDILSLNIVIKKVVTQSRACSWFSVSVDFLPIYGPCSTHPKLSSILLIIPYAYECLSLSSIHLSQSHWCSLNMVLYYFAVGFTAQASLFTVSMKSYVRSKLATTF